MHTRLLLILPFLGLLTQCSPSGSASSKTLPVLSSPSRAKAWGSPQVTPTKDGYNMTYTNPSNEREKVTIVTSRESMFFLVYPPHLKGSRLINGVATPVSEAQVWQHALISGQAVKYYQSHLPTPEHGALFKTLGTELRDHSGNTGNYRIFVEGTKNQMQKWFSELRFDS